MCNRWLSKEYEDSQIERILALSTDTSIMSVNSSANSSKLEIKVKHLDDPDSDADLPPEKKPGIILIYINSS